MVYAVPLVALLAVGCSSNESDRKSERAPQMPAGDKALLASVPILAVEDVGETLDYYERVLGFPESFRWEDGTTYAGVGRGGAWLHFNRMPKTKGTVEGHLVWLTATGVDSLHAEHLAAGANVVLPLADQPWGFREYRVRDNNGYHLRIAEPLPCEDERCKRFEAVGR